MLGYSFKSLGMIRNEEFSNESSISGDQVAVNDGTEVNILGNVTNNNNEPFA